MFCVFNTTSLCCPVFPVCQLSMKQLLIKRYLKHYKPPPVRRVVRLHQYKLCVVFVYYKHDKLAFSCCSVPVNSVNNLNLNSLFGYFPWDFPACKVLIVLSAAEEYG